MPGPISSSTPAGTETLRGSLDCSANPNYPAGVTGDGYYVSVAGKIGGASGLPVQLGDEIICSASNAGGTQAGVGTSWFIVAGNKNLQIGKIIALSGGAYLN